MTSPISTKDPVWSSRLSTGLIGLLTIGLTVCRAACAAAVTQGLTLCINLLLPALFPFFVLSGLVIESGLALRLGARFSRVMSRVFHLPGSCAALFLLGALGGYPTGARAVTDLYRQAQCSKADAERMLALCNNCGPGFFLGVVGSAVLGSARAGFCLWLIHLIAALLCGILFRSDSTAGTAPLPTPPPVSFPHALVRAVSGAVQSALGVCGFVLFFSVLLRLLQESGLFSLVTAWIAIPAEGQTFTQAILSGIFEVSCGIHALAGCSAALPLKGAAATALLSFGGCSVLFQTMQQTENTGLSLRPAIHSKLLQAGLAGLCAFLYLSARQTNIAQVWQHFPAIPICAALLFCGFTLVKVRNTRYNTKRIWRKGDRAI